MMVTVGLQAFSNNYGMAEPADEIYLLDRLERVFADAVKDDLESCSLACLL